LNNTFSQHFEDYLNDIYKKKTNSTNEVFFQTTFYAPVDEKPQMDWSNYLVISLIALICVLGIIGSLIDKIADIETVPVKIIKAFSFYDNFNKIITVT